MFSIGKNWQKKLALLSVCSCYVFISGRPVFAQEHTEVNQSTSSLELDLSSTSTSISGALLGQNEVQVNFGGSNTIVNASSSLTPAQYLAALSVINTGQQTLHVNEAGQATGGTFQLPSTVNLASLSVPTGVTGIHDFASNQNLNLSGNFANSGIFYLVSSSQSVNSGMLSALNIVNNQNALISSVLPSGGLTGFSNLVSGVGFTLNAINNIYNYGVISSSASLNLTAGSQIMNGAVLANISSVNNLSLIAPNIINQGQINSTLANINVQSANLLNSGLLQSARGDISISNLVQQVLDINNSGGLIRAEESLDFTNSFGRGSQINLYGGILEADEISFSSARGSVTVAVEDLSQDLSFSARTVSLDVRQGSSGLNLSGLNRARSVELSYNGEGDIRSGGFRTRGNDLNIITTGSINLTGNIVTTGSGSADAGSVNLQAGESVTIRNINASAAGSADGGDINIHAGESITGRNLDASGGSAGESGSVTLQAENGQISLRNISANDGGAVIISTPDSIEVSGEISAIGGSLSLTSSNNEIGAIDLGNSGTLSLNTLESENGSFVLNLEDLSQYGTSNLSISGNSNIVLSGDCNQCLSGLSSLTLNTTGTFIGTGGMITLDEGQSFIVNASGGIYTGSVRGAGNLSFSTDGLLTVDGNINVENGTVLLSGNSFQINAQINAENGTVVINPLGQAIVSGSQLAQISSSVLYLGTGLANSALRIEGNADLTNVAHHVQVSLAGDFQAGMSSISLANNASMVINADNVSLGSLTGGSALVTNASQNLDLAGNLQTHSGPVVLNADLAGRGASLTLSAGSSISASAVSLNTVRGDINSSADIRALESNLSISSGGGLNLHNNSNLSAAQDLSLSASSLISIGSSSVLNAGALLSNFDPFSRISTFDPQAIGTSGNISINNYGTGETGNIEIGSGVSLVAAGKNGNGNIGILSSADINVQDGARMAALGGNLWLSASDNVLIEGANLVSLATGSANTQGSYTGGQIGIMAGAPDTDMSSLLSGLADNRNASQQIYSDASLSSNLVRMANGSSLTVIQPEDKLIALNNNSINLNGGVLFIDPPPSSTVTVNNSTLTAAGPAIGGSTPVILNPGSSGTGSSTGSGTSTPPARSEVLTGSLTISTQMNASAVLNNSFPASSVNQNDLSTRTTSTQSQQTSFNNQSASVPIDTLDDSQTKTSLRPAIFCSKPQLLRSCDMMDEDNWIIASSSCQPFTFEEHDGSLIVGSGPAKLAPAADRTLLLKEGKILVITVNKVHVVRTPYCNITVPVNTAAVIESDPLGIVRIANLAGGKTSVTICRNDETLILAASPGEQLVLAESSVSETEFSAVSYEEVTHRKVASWNLELSGLRGQKIQFDRQEMAQYEPLLHCSMGCVNQTQLRRLEQLLQSMSSQEVLLKSMDNCQRKGKSLIQGHLPTASKNTLNPVSYQSSSLEGELSFNTLNAGGAQVKYSGRCKVALTSPGLIALESGEALFCANKRTLIKAGDSRIELKPGTLTIVSLQDGLLKIRNLYERKRCSVLATIAGKRVLSLEVGQELLVGPKGISLSRALGQDAVGRRRLASMDLASGHSCISSEISLSSLMQNSSILCQMLRSQEDGDREIAARIMKMSVCISLATANHGNYSMLSGR